MYNANRFSSLIACGLARLEEQFLGRCRNLFQPEMAQPPLEKIARCRWTCCRVIANGIQETSSYAIAKITARCAQNMSALKIVCKRKISRRLRKNLHITILSLFGGEIIFKCSNQCDHGT